MKNKFLKTLGIGALCLATTIGFVGCTTTDTNSPNSPAQSTTNENYVNANLTSLEAYQMYQTALSRYTNNSLTNPSDPTSARYWDNLEVTALMLLGQTTLCSVKLSVGKTDGYDTFVEYEDDASYTIYRMETEGPYTFYQKSGETGRYLISSSGLTNPLQNDETLFDFSNYWGTQLIVTPASFVKAEVNESNNYILHFTVTTAPQREDGWDDSKYYTDTAEYIIYINSAGNLTLYSSTITTEFSSAVTQEEKDEIGYEGAYNFTYSFDYNVPFNQTKIKALIQEVKNNAIN